MDSSLASLPTRVSPVRGRQLCAGFAQQRIVVVGDLMLDHLVTGDARRISPEAPIPVITLASETHAPGGAGNVARNFASLGCRVDLLGVIGTDREADQLRHALVDHGLTTTHLIADPTRPTTVKTRIVAQRHQVLRLDRESTQPLDGSRQEELLARLRTVLPGAAAVVIADYAKGVVEQPLLDELTAHARSLRIPVCLDPKPAHRLRMSGCALLTPNRKETFELAGLADAGTAQALAADARLLEAIAVLQEQHQPEVLLVTLGEAGLLLVERGIPPRHLPTFARQVSDVTGAGDTVMAVFVLARAAGASAPEAAMLANHAAGIVVSKFGTAAVSVEELLAALAQFGGAAPA